VSNLKRLDRGNARLRGRKWLGSEYLGGAQVQKSDRFWSQRRHPINLSTFEENRRKTAKPEFIATYWFFQCPLETLRGPLDTRIALFWQQLATVTVAVAMAAPDGSVMTPVSVPRLVCATAVPFVSTSTQNTIAITLRIPSLIIFVPPSCVGIALPGRDGTTWSTTNAVRLGARLSPIDLNTYKLLD